MGVSTEGHAQQPDAPVNIPLGFSLDDLANSKLQIFVGINGGPPRNYIFDTGSPVFNALYAEAVWPDLAQPKVNGAPGSTVDGSVVALPLSVEMNSAQFCLGGSTKFDPNDPSTFYCRGYTGNLVEVPSLSFYKTTSDPTPVATLNADVGYVINAAWNYGTPDKNQLGPPPFDQPVVDPFTNLDNQPDGYFGTFGAGNFAKDGVPLATNGPTSGFQTQTTYAAGGVLGQTIVSGVMAQGYVVAANGQKNPFSSINAPQQVNGIDVTIGGQQAPVSSCSPCVTVGLTPEMLGQFWAATPTDHGDSGVIPWAVLGPSYQNPYDPSATGNNGSTERGTSFRTTLTPMDGNTPAITETTLSLLDAGTPDLELGISDTTSSAKIDLVSAAAKADPTCLTSGDGCAVDNGVIFEVSGVNPVTGKPIPGLAPTTMVVTDGQTGSKSYDARLSTEKKPGNTIGLPFFAQNSVLYDLTHQVTGYTPFFVTDAPLVTTAGGSLIVDVGNVPLGLAGRVLGKGGVTIRKGGAVQLSAENTYTGPTRVSDGATLFISGPGSIAASSGVSNNGVFDISRAWSAVSIQNLTGSGLAYLGGQNLIITNAAGTFSGTLADVGFSGSLYDGTRYFGFPGTGGGLTLAGGTLTLSGASTYTGPTWVNGGALIVNGSIVSPVTVNKGGTLGGVGSVGATTVSSGGVLAPGNSIGTIRVNGNFTLKSGATYEVEANAQGQSDKVIVNGTVNLTGATLRVLAVNGNYKARTDYTIIENDGSDKVVGTFSQVTSNLAFLRPFVFYNGGDGNDVVLTLLTNSFNFRSVADTRNQRAVAGALDQFPTDNPLFLAVLAQTAEGARQAFDALSGEVHATVAGTLSDDSRYVREAVLGRLMQASHTNGALSAGGPQVASYDSQAMMLGGAMYDGKSLVAEPERAPLAFWTRAFGAWGNFDSDGNAASADRDLGGFISGMDADIGSGWRAGLATGASFSNVDVDDRYSSADVETYHLGGYIGGMAGSFALRGGGMWALNDIDTSRAVVFPGFFERQSASYDADTGQLFGEVAYPIQMGGIALEPFGGLAFVSVDTDSFRENGGPQASLRGRNLDQDVGYTSLGLRAATTMMLGATQVVPHISAAWLHAFDDVTPGASLAFATTGIGFAINGVPLAEDSALLDAGLDFALGDRMSAGVSYTGQYSDSVTDNGVKGRFTWLF
jgi:outer membrane autotransporter protein